MSAASPSTAKSAPPTATSAPSSTPKRHRARRLALDAVGLSAPLPPVQNVREFGRRAAAPKASCWMFKVKRLAEESDMRVVTAFKRMLHLDRWEAEHGEVIGGGVRTGIPGPQDRGQRFA